MRLPFPERFSMWQVSIFAAILCVIQLMEHTSGIFTLCTLLFIVISAIAFNISGGLTKPSGGFIFSYALLGAIIGIVYKALVGEPGQTHLLQPERTIEVFLAGSVAMFIAALLAQRFAVKKSFLDRLPVDRSMSKTATICLIIGLAYQVYATIGPTAGSGSLLRALSLLNGFLSSSMLFGVTAAIRESGGRRSVNLTVLIGGATIFVVGVISFSKQGMYTPIVCWLLAAAVQRYKVSVLQIGGLLAGLFLINYYLVPYSQYGRGFVSEDATYGDNVKLSMTLLSNLDLVREAYLRRRAEDISEGLHDNYYDRPAGIFDRLQMIAPDDNLIDLTENGSVFGYIPILYEVENIIPHFIWKNKPEANFGNIYAHEVGLIPEEDTTTGISFSPSGDAFHQGRWIAVLLVMPAMLAFLFWGSDAIGGDLRKSPLALGYLVSFLHAAPEGGVGGIISLSSSGQVIAMLVFGGIAYCIQPLCQLLPGAESRTPYPPPQQNEISTGTGLTGVVGGPEASGALFTGYRWSRGRAKT